MIWSSLQNDSNLPDNSYGNKFGRINVLNNLLLVNCIRLNRLRHLFQQIAFKYLKMIKVTRILVFILLNAVIANAQVNLAMHNRIASDVDMDHQMFILVKGDVNEIRKFVNEQGGTYLNSAGDIASVKLSVNSIAALATKKFVRVIGSDVHNYRTMNDTMRMLAHVNEVHAGQAPLVQPYHGSNVLLGIIDSGLDLTHPDFKDSTGHTRVKWLWDMNLVGAGAPAPYNYGREFTQTQIDNGQATAHTGTDQFGHGTYVTGIAGSNGLALGHWQGVATQSDLIIVAYNFTAQDTVSRMAHAVEYIFSKAQQLGRPVVINASLGDYYGSHDGMDLESQYISYMINQQAGRVIVASAGNIGANYPYHVGRTCNGDTMFNWIKYNAAYPGCYFQVFADTADFNNILFSIGADKTTPDYSFRGQTAFTSVFPSINNVVNQNLVNNGNRIGRIQTFTSINGGVYSIEVFITPDSTSYYWRFTTTGTGHYDSWTFDWNITGVPGTATYPEMAKYWPPDTLSSLVSGINCLDNVISVANYNNTDRHYDVDTVLQTTATDYPGQLGPNSGRGPTRDGRMKPDVAAPGNHIISDAVLSLVPGTQHNKIAVGGMHITGGGTSASAPVISGVAALYLEENPGANWFDVKHAITTCAMQDSLMWGPYPNNAWGFGKVNAFEALTTCSMNVAIHEVDDNGNLLIYPNPAASKLNVVYNAKGNFRMHITDITGRVIFENVFSENLTVDLNGFPDGIYILRIESSEGMLITRKFVVQSNRF
jgi:hypothetical protein